MALRPSDLELNKLGGQRLRNRQVDELIGIAKGIVADGILTNPELEMLVRWLVANREITSDPIVAALYRQIHGMLRDGKFDEEERADLLGILQGFSSNSHERGEPMLSTVIPFSTPPPMLGFAGWRYCFTGTFNYGTRAICEQAVIQRGAAAGSLTQLTDVLVVGHYATESWLHSPYGLKIIKAASMQDRGHHVVIVPEEQWASQL